MKLQNVADVHVLTFVFFTIVFFFQHTMFFKLDNQRIVDIVDKKAHFTNTKLHFTKTKYIVINR